MNVLLLAAFRTAENHLIQVAGERNEADNLLKMLESEQLKMVDGTQPEDVVMNKAKEGTSVDVQQEDGGQRSFKPNINALTQSIADGEDVTMADNRRIIDAHKKSPIADGQDVTLADNKRIIDAHKQSPIADGQDVTMTDAAPMALVTKDQEKQLLMLIPKGGTSADVELPKDSGNSNGVTNAGEDESDEEDDDGNGTGNGGGDEGNGNIENGNDGNPSHGCGGNGTGKKKKGNSLGK